jgi:hypothetical protein
MSHHSTKTRNPRRAKIAAVLAVAGALAVPGLASAAQSDVSIQAQQGGFFGYVHSPKQKCEQGRTVQLFKVRSGDDRLIGTDLAQPNGPDSQWFVNTNKPGSFYAHIDAKGNCAAATSPVVQAQA